MTPEERQNYVRYRLNKADETLEEAGWMAEKNHWNTCANRLYYAAFYAVTALLVQNGHTTQTHKGVKTLFALHFIKTGLISLEANDLYSGLFDKRQKGDYNDFFDWTDEDILPLIEPTKELIETIRQLIDSK